MWTRENVENGVLQSPFCALVEAIIKTNGLGQANKHIKTKFWSLFNCVKYLENSFKITILQT